MSISTVIALRYMRTTKNNSYLSWITILSILGVTIGIAAMIVVLSVIDGFENELRTRFLSANAHVLAYRHPAGIKDYEKWEQRIKKDFPKEIKGTSPFIQNETMIRHKSIIQSILIKAVDPLKRNSVQSVDHIIRPINSLKYLQKEIKDYKKSSSYPEVPSIILGQGLINLLQVKIGDEVQLIVPAAEESMHQFLTFKIVGIYDSGLQHYDNKLGVMSIPAAQKLFSYDDIVTGIEIGLFKPDLSDIVADKMKNMYSLSIKEWKSYNVNVFKAMEEEKRIIALLVWLVATVAGLNILTTLFISVNQKQREISILKALGATNWQILLLFLKQSLMIGFIGSVSGCGLAYIIGNLIEKYQFIDIPEVYLLSSLPVEYDLIIYIAVALSGILVCCLAGLFPAWSATRITPTEGFTGRRNLA